MKQITFSNIAVSDLCRQLSLFLKAGLRLSDGLYLLSEEETDADYRSFLTELAQQLEQGSYFHEILESAGCFPIHMTGLLKIGEETGRLEETLSALAQYYEHRDRTSHFIKNTLIYPSLLFITMASVITVLLTKVLPIFEDVYASLGGKLDGVAGGLLAFGTILNKILPILVLLLIFALLLLFYAIRNRKMKSFLLQYWQSHYGDRGISRKINDAHFAQALSMAISSGMPLEDGILLARNILKEYPQAVNRCDLCLSFLASGEELAVALKNSDMLPASCCRMLSLGIRAGTSDQVMEDISRRLSEEADRALESRISMIEPALVITTSLLVGLILFSVMLPLMNIMKTIG